MINYMKMDYRNYKKDKKCMNKIFNKNKKMKDRFQLSIQIYLVKNLNILMAKSKII